MAKRKVANPESEQSSNLLAAGMHDVAYMITVSLEKFDMDQFIKAIGGTRGKREFGGLVFAPKNEETGEYYVRFNWFVEDQEANLRADYFRGTRKHADDERPPYAEEFMAWLGKFFKYGSAQVHTHAHLQFPLKKKRSLFPLPLKTGLSGEPVIDGISLRLPSKTDGVSRVRISLGSKSWYVEVVADRRVYFDTFSIYEDLNSYSATLSTLMEDAT